MHLPLCCSGGHCPSVAQCTGPKHCYTAGFVPRLLSTSDAIAVLNINSTVLVTRLNTIQAGFLEALMHVDDLVAG